MNVADLGNSERVYYLEGCADLLFGADSQAEGEEGIGDKFIKKSESEFTGLAAVLNEGPGGKNDDETPKWTDGELFPELLAFRSDVTSEPGLEPDVSFDIGTREELLSFKDYLRAHPAERIDVKLTGDITVDGWDGSIGMDPDLLNGSDHVPYKGTFDGDGHLITLVNEDLPHGTKFGLFMNVSENSVIKNLSLDITGRSAREKPLFSPLALFSVAGTNYGTISDVSVNCALLGENGTGAVSGGGNYDKGRIERVSVNGWIENANDISGSASGIAIESQAGSVITHCVNNATVKGKKAVGGIVYGLSGRLEYSANHGDVINTGGDTVGGLAGVINYASSNEAIHAADIYNCYNAGDVSGPGMDKVGGLVGTFGKAFEQGKGIVNSFNYGQVTVTNGQSAAIIANFVYAANLAASSSVYYLEGCADLIFGPNSPPESEVSDIVILKEINSFVMKLPGLLNEGPGGSVEDEPLWEAGMRFPILRGLGDAPLEKPESPFDDGPAESTVPNLAGETWIIGSEQEFLDFAQEVNAGGTHLNATLTNNLKFDDWTPINPLIVGAGKFPFEYNGTFDGNGNTIELKETGDISFTALFYSIGSEGVVKDLVVSVDFTGSGGAIAGVAVKHSGRIITTSATSEGAAGIVNDVPSGRTAVLSECVNYGEILAEGIAQGFAGTMESCANYGTITAPRTYVAGLVYAGKRANIHYINCYNTGTVKQLTEVIWPGMSVGGLFGCMGLPGHYVKSHPDHTRS
ncbi:MAG: hypothetical protein LBS75_05710 [Synergistaceae bacterium]|nr:hypothetical protein [Synergistaceae bacterium]